jgi:hypothetical protein
MSKKTYSRVIILPEYREDAEDVHSICSPDDRADCEGKARIAVRSPSSNRLTFFDVEDGLSLQRALEHEGSFPFARKLALSVLDELLSFHKANSWDGGDGDVTLGYREFITRNPESKVRKEVWELIVHCCRQERRLVDDALHTLCEEILEERH